jgi:hypothetical protein
MPILNINHLMGENNRDAKELLLGRRKEKGLGLPILIGPRKRTRAIDMFHIVELKSG